MENGAAEEDWRWDLNPGVAAIPKRGPRSLGRAKGENHVALAEWVVVIQLMEPGA